VDFFLGHTVEPRTNLWYTYGLGSLGISRRAARSRIWWKKI